MTNLIQTERLTLVPLTRDHIGAFHVIWSDPGATQWSLHGRNSTIEASEEWMTGIMHTPAGNKRRSWLVYIANALDAGKCMGLVTLRPPKDPAKYSESDKNTWELGYLYRSHYWGQGYATESCRAAIESFTNELDVHIGRRTAKLVAWICVGNDASLRVCEKLGFKVTAHKKLGGPDRFLGGQWREDAVVIVERDL